MAKTFDTPIYHDGERFKEIPGGQYIDPALIPLDSSRDNAIEVTDDGLYAASPDVTVVSADSGNVISKGSDGGALLTQLALDSLINVYMVENPVKVVSENDWNLIRPGTDQGAHLTADDVLSNGDVNLLTVDATDHKIILNEKTFLENVTLVSCETECNVIGKDEDGRIYVCPADMIADADPFLYVDDDGKIASEATLAYDDQEGTFKLVNHAGDVVTEVTVKPTLAVLKNVELDGTELVFTFALADGTERVLRVDLKSFVDVYQAGDGLKLEDGTFSVDLAQTGHLYINQNGRLAVDVDSLVSEEDDNILEQTDGKLYVRAYHAGTALVLDANNYFHVRVSDQEGNKLRVESDGGLYAEGIVDASEIISSDEGNALDVGSDKLLFFPCDWGIME